MGLEQLVQNGPTGLVAGYMGGAKVGADLRSSLATSGQTLAQTDRYTQETPSFLQKSRADARAAELGNMQGEADAAAGVYGAKAGVSMENAKVDALKAKQALEQMPAEHRAKYMAAIQQGNMQMLDLVEQTLTQTSDIPSTIGIIEQQYPQVTKDPSWNMEKQKVSGMAPQQALNYIRELKAKLASSDAYGDAKFQGDMIKQGAQDAAAMERARLAGEYGLKGDQIRASASSVGANKENTTMAIRRLSAIIADPNTTEEQKVAAEYELQAQLKFGQQTESSGIDPMFDVNKAKTLPPRPGKAPVAQDLSGLAKASFGSYEPSKYDYRINPSTGKVQRKPK